MIYVRSTAPTAEPVTLTEMKTHLRVDGTDDDTLITALITAARQHVEDMCNVAIVAQTWKAYDLKWPNEFRLQRPPLVSVSSITHIDSAGSTQTASTDVYDVDTDSVPGRVYEAYGEVWPSDVRGHDKDICLTYIAGHTAVFTANTTTDVITVTGRSAPADAAIVRVWNLDGALPTGLSANTDYHVRDGSGSTFKLAASAGGAAIDITGAGTGTHYLGDVPAGLRHLIKLIVAHWYEHREPVIVGGGTPSPLPMAIESLIWANRTFQS